MKIKIDDVKSYDGFERHVEGTYDLNGKVYNFDLDTYDGMTSICFVDDNGEIIVNLEEYDVVDIGLTEDEGELIFDEILDFVNDYGYNFIGEDFE